MNMQSSLMHELMLNKFKLGHNITEANQNISCVKGQGIVDHSKKMAREISLVWLA